MSKYTTGELARLCGVSVRTVQYYDSRNILVPSKLTDGGRRLYSDDDLRRMRMICFLREAGVSINQIGELFADAHPERILSILLDQQREQLLQEISEGKSRLDMIESIKRELRGVENFSVESIADIAKIMKNKNKLTKMRLITVLTGIPVTALQWTAIVLGITNGLWWLLAIWAAVAIPWGIAVSAYYFKRVDYVCPECHEVFRPKFKEAFWAYHTPKMRRLSCPKCGRRGLCVEIYSEKEKNNG